MEKANAILNIQDTDERFEPIWENTHETSEKLRGKVFASLRAIHAPEEK